MTNDLPDGGLSRRRFLQIAGVTTGVGATGVALPEEYSPVGQADAIPPVVIAGAALGGGAAIGWALREYGIVGADSPSEGLSGSALLDEVDKTARARHSNNQSTFVDNQNIFDGIEHSTYSEGKIAAIDALNAQKTQAEVESDAIAAVDKYATTIEKNFLKSWNESIHELYNMISAIQNHADTTALGTLETKNMMDGDSGLVGGWFNSWNAQTSRSMTLADGTSFTLERYCFNEEGAGWQGPYDTEMDFLQSDNVGPSTRGSDDAAVWSRQNTAFIYLNTLEWNSIWTDMQATFTAVRDGLILWVDKLYTEVQSGELDTADLLTSAELAAMNSDDTSFNQAVADLMALNVSVNLEREAEVYLTSLDATVYGSLAVTGDATLSPGTIDPTADANSYYLTYDISRGSGGWSDYQTGIDGGNLTFTSEPLADVIYHVTTVTPETVDTDSTEFVDNGDGTWTADLSAKLEDDITNVDTITWDSGTSETDYTTVQLTEPFEIIAFTDSEGTEYSTVSYSSEQPHADNNYLSKGDWDTLKQRQQELIDKFNEASDTAGGGGGALFGNGFLDFLSIGNIPGAAVGLGGAAAGYLALGGGGSGGFGGLGGSGGSGGSGRSPRRR